MELRLFLLEKMSREDDSGRETVLRVIARDNLLSRVLKVHYLMGSPFRLPM